MNSKALPLVALASLVAGLVACSADAEDPTSAADGTTPPAASSTAGSGSTPEYGYSCQGVATPKSVAVATNVAPRCVGAGPDSGTFGGGIPNCGPSCAKQDVTFGYEPPAMRCGSKDLYFWDGAACVAQSTTGEGGMLRCKGNDCDKLYPSKDECEAARSQCPR